MYAYIVYCLYLFFVVLEMIILLYILFIVLEVAVLLFHTRNFLPLPAARYYTGILAAPMIAPMQKILKHSIMNCFRVDISPYVLMVLLSFLQRFCMYLMKVG